ncbi:RraA family protein [Catenulispora subtropica]|uniref:Putative 4-hydroxy-4-methyl-2-oxoglutarate aldolase n=1 Tax=Catenulispora subtropica TaxID=450798 RepID=A0ABN2THH5_9ACTN
MSDTTPGTDTGPGTTWTSPTTLADLLGGDQVMDIGIRALWTPAPRVAGPAFTVRCPPGDNLMLHAAIYRAEPGSVIVVESGDLTRALAGGNVMRIAQRRGVAGFVLDGTVRDIAEAREAGFGVYGRGVVPIPGDKGVVAPLNEPVRVGGVTVHPGDVVVADEEGIVVVPGDKAPSVFADAAAKQAKEQAQTLEEWEAAHRAKIEALLAGRR